MGSAAGVGAPAGRVAEPRGAAVEHAATMPAASANEDVEMRMESHPLCYRKKRLLVDVESSESLRTRQGTQAGFLEGYMTQITSFLLRHSGSGSYGCLNPPMTARPRSPSQ